MRFDSTWHYFSRLQFFGPFSTWSDLIRTVVLVFQNSKDFGEETFWWCKLIHAFTRFGGNLFNLQCPESQLSLRNPRHNDAQNALCLSLHFLSANLVLYDKYVYPKKRLSVSTLGNAGSVNVGYGNRTLLSAIGVRVFADYKFSSHTDG